MHNDFMAIRHGVPGHDNGTAILRARPARMIDGHINGGYQVPRDLQQLRGPSESLASGLAAFRLHIGLVEATPATEALT